MKVFSFDVESIGLHGEGFAVGVVITEDGVETRAFHFAADPSIAKGAESSREWVAKNVPPIEITHETLTGVRGAFWSEMLEARNTGAIILSDCGWPVEANFLSACVADDPGNRNWEGPYPLVDVSAVVLASGVDPVAVTERLPNELPFHNPICDARQSARMWHKYAVVGL